YAVDAMVKHGLRVDSVENAKELMLALDTGSPTGKETITRFLKKVHAPLALLEVGFMEYQKGRKEMTVAPLPGAIEALQELRKEGHDLVLISTGEKETQQRKMIIAGINMSWFRKIIIVKDYDKKDKYKEVCTEWGCMPEQVMVIGDKFKTDLLPARELGMKTVYVRHGRGLADPPKIGEVDYMIKDLGELPSIVEDVA
ncbi:MAG: HAD family hydrolase, partial [Nanoarchaeota archaeon]